MGRGSSKVGGGSGGMLSKADKNKITSGIENHTSAQNDGAEAYYQRTIQKEKDIIDNYSNYVKMGKIKDKSDPWWQGHQNTYDSLVAQYDFFKKERKRLGR